MCVDLAQTVSAETSGALLHARGGSLRRLLAGRSFDHWIGDDVIRILTQIQHAQPPARKVVALVRTDAS